MALIYQREKAIIRALLEAPEIKRHLWYLGEELVGFSLFSNNVSVKTKVSMVQGLRSTTQADAT